MTEEIFVSGYCRTINANRMICCEFGESGGKPVLETADCDYGVCKYSSEWRLIRQAGENAEKGQQGT